MKDNYFIIIIILTVIEETIISVYLANSLNLQLSLFAGVI